MTSASDLQKQTALTQCLLLQNPYEIFDHMADYLRRAEFLVLRRVCKALRYAEDLGTRFDVDRQLQHFLCDPLAFRLQIGKHAALISGNFALNYFGSCHADITELDLVVSAGEQSDGLIQYMEDAEGYKQAQDSADSWGIEPLVFKNSERVSKMIRLRITANSPIEEVLGTACTTANVNFLTCNKAYCVFPFQTIVCHKFHTLKPMNDDLGSFLRQAREIDWSTRDMIMRKDMSANLPYGPRGCRRVGDRFSLIIPLKTHNMQQPPKQTEAIEFAQFVLSGPNPFAADNNLALRLERFTSPVLRHGYTYGNDVWYDFVKTRLQIWQRIELYKMKPDQRPQDPETLLPHHAALHLPESFQIPPTWDYADDLIPEWYMEWEEIPPMEPTKKQRHRI